MLTLNSTSDLNVGDLNVGDLNVGDVNVGDLNVGDLNVGDLNVGDLNVGDVNVGDLNVVTPLCLKIIQYQTFQTLVFKWIWYLNVPFTSRSWILIIFLFSASEF